MQISNHHIDTLIVIIVPNDAGLDLSIALSAINYGVADNAALVLSVV